MASRSEKRIDHRFKEAYQNHIKEAKSKRKNKVDERLVRFTANKNVDLFLNLESNDKSREEIRKPKISNNSIINHKRKR